MKKPKITAVLISSREGLSAAVTQIVHAKLRHAELTVQMEQEITDIQKRYQDRLSDLEREIGATEAGVQLYCEQHREEDFAKKKSINLVSAIVGFREAPVKVEKVRSKDTFDSIALQMAVLVVLNPDKSPLFTGEDYITYPAPQLDKNALRRDRDLIPPEVLRTLGLRFIVEELFYIEPKSEIAEASVKEAA